MKTLNEMKFSLVAVLVEDETSGGYTAFFKQFPEVIAQGTTIDDAIDKLLCALHDVFKFQGRDMPGTFSAKDKVVERSVDLCTAPCS